MSLNSLERDKVLRELQSIIIETLKNLPVDVYLFGSWARNAEKRTSDIDVAFESKKDIPMKTWVELHDKIEESTIPYHVDLVDLTKTDAIFTKKVKKEGILWQDCMNE